MGGTAVYVACLLGAWVLSAHYPAVHADVRCETRDRGLVIYSCEDEQYCCDGGCCNKFFTQGVIIVCSFLGISFLIVTCMICVWCIFTRSALRAWRGGTVYAQTGVTVVPPGGVPQGQPSYPPAQQPPYPSKPPYGPAPPDYPASAPYPTGNQQVPIGFAPVTK